MSCLRLEIFLAIDFFFSLITQHEKKSRNFSTGQKHSTPRQHDGPLGIRNEERRNEERHQTNLSKTQKIIDKELINKLPRDIILIISKMHPLIIPPFTNKTLRRAVKDYLAGGDRKKRIVEKYGEISNWDTSRVTNMRWMFKNAESFDQPLNNWDVSNVTNMFGMLAMFRRATSFNQPLNNWNVSNVGRFRV